MPRFFFSLEDHEGDIDHEGTELSGPVAARISAVTYLGEYLRDHPDLIWDGHRFAVLVEDENRNRIFHVQVESDEDRTEPAHADEPT